MTVTLSKLPTACALRGAYVRSTYGPTPNQGVPAEIVAYRLGWDAYAAGEIPRPMLQTAADLADSRPDLAADVWHHTAGATILGTLCCGTPASHRDALAEMARTLRAGQ